MACGAGQRVGLLGGTFDPPHAGHLHLARAALRWCGLDRVWWVPAGLNPLKQDRPPHDSHAARIRQVRDQVRKDPRIRVFAPEHAQGLDYTVQTVGRIRRCWPRLRFVWVMGADSFGGLLSWREPERLMRLVPLAVFARPDAGRVLYEGAASRFRRYYRRNSRMLVVGGAPGWSWFPVPMLRESSSRIRAQRRAAEIGGGLA